MWETNSDYCDFHESRWDDDYPCECHILRAEDIDADRAYEMWKLGD